MRLSTARAVVVCLMCSALCVGAAAQQRAASGSPPSGSTAATVAASSSFVIGPDDVLTVLFWGDKNMSADATVRPDGKISLPLINEVQAAGLTTDQLRAHLVELASKYLEDPNATVAVKEIHSRNVYITGNVTKPGTYALSSGMNVLQLIAVSGGLLEYSDAKKIVVIRNEGGAEQYHKFNYNDVVKQKHAEQNITLKPGDTVVVP